MALAAVVSDRAWYAIDVYQLVGTKLHKLVRKGPFEANPTQARAVRADTLREHPDREIRGYVYDQHQMRWVKWP